MQEEPTSLRIEDPGIRALFTEAGRYQARLDVEAALAERDRAKQALARVGQPAVPALLRALENDFDLGRPGSRAGRLNAAARLQVVQTLALMGPKGRTPAALLALADPAPDDPPSTLEHNRQLYDKWRKDPEHLYRPTERRVCGGR